MRAKGRSGSSTGSRATREEGHRAGVKACPAVNGRALDLVKQVKILRTLCYDVSATISRYIQYKHYTKYISIAYRRFACVNIDTWRETRNQSISSAVHDMRIKIISIGL